MIGQMFSLELFIFGPLVQVDAISMAFLATEATRDSTLIGFVSLQGTGQSMAVCTTNLFVFEYESQF